MAQNGLGTRKADYFARTEEQGCIMNTINLSFLEMNSGVTVKGELFDSKNSIVLSEDLLEISLPSGRNIDVGWYPEHDPSGSYRITLYRDRTDYPLRQITKSQPLDVVATIRE